MLVLSRRVNEAIDIGNNVRVTVVGMDGDRVKLGVEAPRDLVVRRSELVVPAQDALAAEPGTLRPSH